MFLERAGQPAPLYFATFALASEVALAITTLTLFLFCFNNRAPNFFVSLSFEDYPAVMLLAKLLLPTLNRFKFQIQLECFHHAVAQ